jgi:hypothetical protein
MVNVAIITQYLTGGVPEIQDPMNELFRYPSSIEKGYNLDLNQLGSKISVVKFLTI